MSETVPLRGRVRAWDLPENLCPDDEREFARWWPRLRPRARLLGEGRNLIVAAGLKSIAGIMGSGVVAVADTWKNGKAYWQALGTGKTTPAAADTKLGEELIRKAISYTSVSTGGTWPVLIFTTYFTPTDFWSAQTSFTGTYTGPGGNGLTTLSVASTTGFRRNDLVQIAGVDGYIYHPVYSIGPGQVLNFVNADAPPSTVPSGASIIQVVSESGVFGEEIVKPGTMPGTVNFADGSAPLTGVGTTFTAQGAKALKGNAIRRNKVANATAQSVVWAEAGRWYDIADVLSATQLTLTTAVDGSDAINGSAYALLGTMFNHAGDLRFVKLSTRGFVLENDWTLQGS